MPTLQSNFFAARVSEKVKPEFFKWLIFLSTTIMSLFSLNTAWAQVYTNGNVSTGSTNSVGSVAPTGTTWSEVQAGNSVTTVNATNNTSTPANSAIYVAEDFTVCSQWTISKFTFYGIAPGYTSPLTISPFNKVTIAIYNGDPGTTGTLVWGSLSTNIFSSSVFANMYRVANGTSTPNLPIWRVTAETPGLILGPNNGNPYWVVFSLGSTQTATYTFPSTVLGSRTQPGNNAQTRTGSLGLWTGIIDNANPQDIPFYLEYTTGACSGTPTPGNTTVTINGTTTTAPTIPAAICGSVDFSLKMANPNCASGVNYQWQDSINAASGWVNITGATASSLSTNFGTLGIDSSNVKFRCKVTCTNGGSFGYSNPITVKKKANATCYCIPDSTNCRLADEFLNIKFGGINNSSSGCSGRGYTDYSSSVGAGNVFSGINNSLTFTINNGGSTEYVGVWIDYNHSGGFESNEYTDLGLINASNVVTQTRNILIPTTSLTGPTRMRIRVFWAYDPSWFDYCSGIPTYTYGETEDYTVNITQAVACSGTPAQGTATATVATTCPNVPFDVTVSNATALASSAGLTLQWETSTNNGTTWVNVAGETGVLYSGAVLSTGTNAAQFRLKATCTNSNLSSYSTVVTVTRDPNPINCYCIPLRTDCTQESKINKVVMSGINQISTCSTNPTFPGYNDYTTTTTGNLYAGTDNQIIIATAATTQRDISLWIDFDKDGTFDDAEYYHVGFTSSTVQELTYLINIPSSVQTGLTRMRIRLKNGTLSSGEACGSYSFGETEDYLVNIQTAVGCNASTNPGNILTSDNQVCSGVSFRLYSSNSAQLSGTTGLTFQWQSSTDSINWTNVGLPDNVYTDLTTSITTTTYIRLGIACSLSGGAWVYSPGKKITLKPSNQCYCTPVFANSTYEDVFNVTLNNLNQSSDCSSVGTGSTSLSNRYSDYTSGPGAPAPAILYMGTNNNISLQIGSCAFSTTNSTVVWIDLNKNGVFETPGERLYIGTPQSGAHTETGTLAIPSSGITPGTTRMRVVNVSSNSSPSSITPCGSYTGGEAEDYLVDLQNAPLCDASYTPATPLSTANPVCPGVLFTLSCPNATGTAGLTFQWESSADNSSWAPIAGATSANYTTTISASRYFRIKSTCGSTVKFSGAIQMTITNTGCYCTPTTVASTCTYSINNVTIGGINNNSACDNGGYTYFGSVSPALLSRGSSTPISLNVTSGGNRTIAIWVDFNQNNQFDDNEFYSISSANGGVMTGAVPIPGTALTGLTRMRIRISDGGLQATADCPTSITAGEMEDYQVNIVDCFGAVFNSQPSSSTVACGSNTLFGVDVSSGAATITYQWQYRTGLSAPWTNLTNNATYTGVTTNELNIISATVSMNGYQYRVYANGSCSTADTSNIAVLTVTSTTPTIFNTQPPNTTINCNGNGSISVAVTTVPVNTAIYQWQFRANSSSSWVNVPNSAPFSNPTTATLSITSGSLSLNNYQFRVYVKGGCSLTDTSNTAVLTVNGVNLGVSIASNAPSNSICKGSSVTFTATPTPATGLTSPAYRWYIDNITTVTGSTGTVINTTNTTQLSLGMAVTVSGGTGSFPSNTTIVAINPGVSFTVSNTPNVQPAAGAIISGKVADGIGITTYTTSLLDNGNSLRCVLGVIDNSGCTFPNPATSNIVTMDVTPNTPVNVSLAASQTTICAGNSVTFTATPTNGGVGPQYEFFIGTTSVQAPSSSTTYINNGTLINGQSVTCKLTAGTGLSCPAPVPATSNAISMTVNPSFPVSVVLSANPGVDICPGTNVIFTATGTNPGTTPTYVFKKNGTTVQTSSSNTYSSNSLVNGDVITCTLTSSIISCTNGTNPATSNTLTISIQQQVASVSLATSPANPCAGASVTYTATAVNGGSAPTYQFYVNGVAQPNTGNTWTYIPGAGDSVSVEMSSSLGCALPNPATAFVIQTLQPRPSANISISNVTCNAGFATLDAGAAPGAGTISSIQWQYGATSGTVTTNVGTGTPTYYTNTIGYYKVTVTNSIGCSFTTDVFTGLATSIPAPGALNGIYTIGALTAANASSTGTTITVTSTSNIVLGAIVNKLSGTGTLAPNTVVTAITSATTFTVNTAPTVTLSAASLAFTTCSNYISLTAAVNDLNTRGISANCTFNIQAGYTETLSAGLILGNATLNSQLATRSVIFQKNGSGANPIITAQVGTKLATDVNPDGILTLAGVDNVTIDGINFIDGNTSSNTTMMEYGIGLFRLTNADGAQNNTIKNCTITVNKNNFVTTTPTLMPTGSAGILMLNSVYNTANAASTAIGNAASANSNNKFYSNNINNGHVGIYMNGFAPATGGIQPTDADLGNDVGGTTLATGNTITNFGGGVLSGTPLPTYGVYAKAQWGSNVSFNTITSSSHGNHVTGILMDAAVGANVGVNNNNINITTSLATGILQGINGTAGNFVTGANNTVNITNNIVTATHPSMTSGTFTGIISSATAASVNLNGNTVQNVVLPATSTGTFTGIQQTGLTVLNMNGNTIQNNDLPGSNTFLALSNTAADTVTLNIVGNTIRNNRKLSTGSASGGIMTLIGVGAPRAGVTTCSTSVTNNTIRNNSIACGASAGSATLKAIVQTGSSIYVVDNNTIDSIYITGVPGTIAATLRGYDNAGGAQNETVKNNTVSNMFITGTSTGLHLMAGIFNNTAGGATRTVNNNKVFNLYTNTTSSGSIQGIDSRAGGTVNIFNNRVYNLYSGAGAGSLISGIRILSGGGNGVSPTINFPVNTFNNMIALNLSNASTVTGGVASDGVMNSPEALRGIDIQSAVVSSFQNVYHNTIYLKGTGAAASSFGATGIFHAGSATATTATLDMRNNIITNECIAPGSGLILTIKRSNGVTGQANFASTSDRNLLYAGLPSITNRIYTDGTTSYPTLADYQAAVATREANSLSFKPEFVSSTDVHLSPASTNATVQFGDNLSSILPLLVTDIDGETRGSGGARPYVGADETSVNAFAGFVNSNATVCPGSSGTLTLVSYTGTILRWEYSFTGIEGTYIDAGNAGSATFNYTNLNVNTYFRAVVEFNSVQSPSAAAFIQLFTKPVISLTSGGSEASSAGVCVNATRALFATTTPAPASPWITTNTSLATISNSGVVTGVAAGNLNVIFTNNNGCKDTVPIIVGSLPTITGNSSVCVGGNTTLTGSGTPDITTPWASSNSAIATVSTLGVVSGVAAGTTNITYKNDAGCATQISITVVDRPTVTGTTTLCVGNSTTLNGSGTPTSWVSSSPSTVSVNGGGFIQALVAGSATITYTNSIGCTRDAVVTVNPLPSISGTLSACQNGGTASLTGTASPATTGTWTSANTSIASVSGNNSISATVTAGTTSGSTGITYTNSNNCKATVLFTVNPLPTQFNITGSGAYCIGGTGVEVGLSSSQTGMTYQLVRQGTPNTNVGSPVTGTNSAISFGLQTAGTYSIVATNTTTNCTQSMTGTAIITTTPLPQGSLSVSGPFCTSGSPQLTYTSTAGTGPFTIVYNDGTANRTITDVVSGIAFAPFSTNITTTTTYTLISVTDANGCIRTSTFSGASATATVNTLPAAIIQYTTAPFCGNNATAQAVTLTGTAGGTYSASPVGLSINTTTGAITPSTSTVGNYTVTYTIAAGGGCPSVTATDIIDVTTPPTASISYAGAPFCTSITTAQSVTQTGTIGGLYTATPAGLQIDQVTGAITPSSSTPGTYTVTYTIGAIGGCNAINANTSVTITAERSATITYAGSPYCTSLVGNISASITGSTGGVFSSTPGLTISASTGAITPSSSSPGTYTISYTLAAGGGCAADVSTYDVTITGAPSSTTISYAGSPFCRSLTTPQGVLLNGTDGGVFTGQAGLSINATTGAITPSSSAAGTYTVTYNIPAQGGCASFSTNTSVTVTTPPTLTNYSYASSPFCKSVSTPQNAFLNATTFTGTFSSIPAGLTIQTTGTSPANGLGAITPSTSTAGTYTVKYLVAASGGCPADSLTTSVTVTAVPNATFSYSGSPFCSYQNTPQLPTFSGTSGGTFSATPGGITLNGTDGGITPSSSALGNYNITYTVPAGGGCNQYTSSAVAVTVNASGNTGALSGIYDIPGSVCRDFPTIKDAVSYLNTNGISGAVTFRVAAGYSETLTSGLALGSGSLITNATNTLTFQKSGIGSNPLITAQVGANNPNAAAPDGIWSIRGTDYVTIDGIDLRDTTTTPVIINMDYGYGLFKTSSTDGVQNTTIRNCTITLNKNNVGAGSPNTFAGSVGILMANTSATATGTALNATQASGANSNNKFFGNTVQNANIGIGLRGFSTANSSNASGLGDANNIVGDTSSSITGNRLIVGGGVGATQSSYGVFTVNQFDLVVANNNITGTDHPAAQTGIATDNQNGTTGVNIRNNNITITGTSATSAYAGIDNTSGNGAASDANILNNIVSVSVADAVATTSGSIQAIKNTIPTTASGAIRNINIIGNTVKTSNMRGSGSTGAWTGIQNAASIIAATAINLNNNIIDSNEVRSTTTSYNVLRNDVMNYNSLTIAGNRIANNSKLFTATTSSLISMANAGGTSRNLFVQNNFIDKDTFAVASTNAGGVTVNVISVTGAESNSSINVNGNTIRRVYLKDVNATYAGTLRAYNSTLPSGLATENVFGNKISNLYISAVNGASGLQTIVGINSAGINIGGGNYNKNIYGNYIDTLYVRNNGDASPLYNSSITAINIPTVTGGGNGDTINIYKNKIAHLIPFGVGATSLARGIWLQSIVGGATTSKAYIHNNMINLDLSEAFDGANASVLTAADAVRGIDLSQSQADSTFLYFNTIRIAGPSNSAAGFGSSAITMTSNAANTIVALLKNNVMVNRSTPGAGGIITAFRKPGTISTYAANSSNNIFYVDTLGGSRFNYYEATTGFTQLTGNWVSGSREANSQTFYIPVFKRAADLTDTLHPNEGASCALSNSGAVLAIPTGGTTDIDGNIRSVSTPDIGAVEFTAIDNNSPAQWAGYNTNWNDPVNWCGLMPGINRDATINGGRPQYPNITPTTQPSQTLRSVTLNSGASINTAAGGKMTFTGNLQLNTGAAFNGKDGVIEMAGSTAQTIQFQNSVIRNLIINSPAVTLQDGLNLTGKLSFVGNNRAFNTGGFLTLKSSDTLTAIVGDLTNNNTNSGNVINGYVTTERFVTSRKAWRLLSMPTKHDLQTIKQAWQEGAQNRFQDPAPGFGTIIPGYNTTWRENGFDTVGGSSSMRTLTNASSSWQPVTTTLNLFEVNKAYLIFTRGDRSVNSVSQPGITTILRERGTLQTGNVVMNLGGTANGQFSAVANPYASPIDFRKFRSGMTNMNTTTYYLWDPQLSTLGGYVSCTVNSDGTITATGSASPYNGNYNIQSGQGFVIANTAANGSITFTENCKVDTISNTSRNAQSTLRMDLYKQVNGGYHIYDGVVHIFADQNNNEVDASDVLKLPNPAENISIAHFGKSLAIDLSKFPSSGDTLHYVVSQMRQASYKLMITPSNMESLTDQAFLEDTYLHSRQAIRISSDNEYTFDVTSDPASAATDRFRIVFENRPTLPVTITEVKATAAEKAINVQWVVSQQQQIRSYQVEKSTDAIIFKPMGSSVLSNGISASSYQVSDIQPGATMNYYRIKIIENNGLFHYSKIVKAQLPQNQPKFVITPNPIPEDGNTALVVDGLGAGNYEWKLYNTEGKMVKLQKFVHDGESQKRYPIILGRQLSKGMYHLEISGSSLKKTVLNFLY